MTEIPRAIWQVSAGPASRSYADVFLNYGVALIGPGDAGAWRPDRSDEVFQGGFVRRFASELALGDIVLLRSGQTRLIAVGIVASGYEYLDAFDDVNGWDLQHARRIRWGHLATPHDFASPLFGANPPRCSRVWNDEVSDFATRFLSSPPTAWQTAPLPALPTQEPLLATIPDAISGLVAQAADLLALMQDNERFGDLPSEDEVIVHFVVPLLRALGWPPERIAVKWRCIDVAVFKALPRTAENCLFVIEAKRLGAGVEGALAQAQGYVVAQGASCNAIVTDGIRYRMYDCAHGFAPVAYANLAWLKQSANELFTRIKRP